MKPSLRSLRAFTLLELMIALAVIGVLSAIAYPLYTTHVQKSHRTAAQSALMELAARQASWRSKHTSYGDKTDLLGITPSIPDPSDSYYSFAVAATTTTFIITAAPQGGQAADSCGPLTMTQNLSGAPSNCW